jgi:hypothetical protein
MIEKINNNNNIPDYMDKPTPKQTNTTGAHADIDADVSVDVNYASFIEKANQIQETDVQAVRRARELLQSGRLDNREFYKQAAEYIIKFGV